MSPILPDWSKISENTNSSIWLRYIDYIFCIWTYGEQELERFLKNLHNFTPKLSFSQKTSKDNIPSLDLEAKLEDVKWETDFHIQSKFRHKKFHYLSSHFQHINRLIVYCHTFIVNRLCSLEKEFNYHKWNMKGWFTKTDYPEAATEK